MEIVASSANRTWNGVVVSGDGRIFVNFPRLTAGDGPAVAEIGKRGEIRAYPGGSWNTWRPGENAAQAFIGTNAVRIGPEGDLWVVDTGTPSFGAGVISGGPKLIRIALGLNVIVKIYPLDPPATLRGSYVDDVRFHGRFAFLTDAGSPGIIVLDLDTGLSRRVLENHESTTASRVITVDGAVVRALDGKPLMLHADQLEVSPDGRWLYFQALAGPMYRIETRWLEDVTATAAQVAAHVELWYDTPPLGGTAMDAAGNIYLNDLTSDSVLRLSPNRHVDLIARDPRLHWADASWISGGWLYLPEAQLDRMAQLNGGHAQIQWPVHIYRLRLPKLPLTPLAT